MLLVLVWGLGAARQGAAQADNARVDGYLGWNSGCMMLRQHDGAVMALVGGTQGLRTGDHVRLAGRFANEPACGAQAFEVTNVDTLWGDDNHRTVRYDHLNGESFLQYAERTGRLDERLAQRDRRNEVRGSYDRDGRYLYHGRNRAVTLVGRLYESDNGCPILRTNYASYALDGDLRAYQSGDVVQVRGTLYDDLDSPCGRPTVVVGRIRGH
jgi:hypothetical protein